MNKIRLSRLIHHQAWLILLAMLAILTLSCNWMTAITDQTRNPGAPLETAVDVMVDAAPVQPTSPGVNATSVPNISPGNLDVTLKPVVFRNLGTVAYTVMPWTYAPFDPNIPAIAPNASTVVFPMGGTSGALSLPLGTYTWCYSWELGDINEDNLMDYAHAIDNRPVTLDPDDNDDLDFAETVDLSAPADMGVAYGVCGMDISQYIVNQQHADNISGALINMGHDFDFVTLKGPITVLVWYIHADTEIGPGVPWEYTIPERVTIPAGQTHTFELVDGREDHPGDWNMYIWLVSIDE